MHTTFYALGCDDKQWKLPSEEYSSVSILLDKRILFSIENQKAIINSIKNKGIKILIVATPVDSFPKQIKKETGCSIIYWLHSQPFWEIENKFGRAKARAELSIKKWFEWNFFVKPFQLWTKRYENKVKQFYKQLYRLR